MKKIIEYHLINKIVKLLPINIKNIIEENVVFHNKVYICGGFIISALLNKPINDMDIYSNNKDVKNALADILINDLKSYNHYNDEYMKKKVIIETENSTTLNISPYPIQLIHHEYYETPELYSVNVDFICCDIMLFYNGKKWICESHEDSINNINNQLIVVNKKAFKINLSRVLKYYSKGFKIDSESLSLVLLKIFNEISPNNNIDVIKLEEYLNTDTGYEITKKEKI